MKKTGLTRPAVVALTLIAALLLALAPAQLVIRKAVGASLYPALMMPSFGAQDPRPDAVSARRLALVGVRSDGTERDLDLPGILPRSQTVPIIIAMQHFSHPAVIEEPETVSWLTRRIDDAYPDDRFVAVRVVWSDTTIELSSFLQTDVIDDEAGFTVELKHTKESDR